MSFSDVLLGALAGFTRATSMTSPPPVLLGVASRLPSALTPGVALAR